MFWEHKLNLHYSPFIHYEGKMDVDFYNQVNESWKDINHEDHVDFTGYRSNVLCKNLLIQKTFKELILNIYDRFLDEMMINYPKLHEQLINMESRVLYSENKPTNFPYKIRDLHLDTGDKFAVGLWYFKHPEEDDDGGNLVLVNPKTAEMKEIKYEENTIVFFPNLPTSWHLITPRTASKYPRRFINIMLEVVDKDKKLHNYQRSGPEEFRGKLINYYK